MKRTTCIFMIIILLCSVVFTGCTKSPEEKRKAYIESAEKYMSEKKFAEAAIQYQNALKIAPDEVSTLINLGDVQIKLKRVSEAYKNFSQANKVDPANIKALEYLAAIELLAKKYDLASTHASEILKHDSQNLKAKEILSQALFLTGKKAEAIEVMEGILKNHDPSEGIIMNAIQMYLVVGRVDDALNLISKGISLYPNSTRIRFLASEIYVFKKDIEAAKKWAEDAYKVAEDNIAVGIALARFYAEQHMDDLLNNQLTELKTKFPQSSEPYMLEAAVIRQKGDIDGALAAAKKAYDLNDNTQTRTMVSQLLLEKGDDQEAIKILEKTIVDDTKAIPPRILLAQINLDKKNPDKALLVMDELIKTISVRPDIAGIAAQAYLMKGDLKKAKDFVENSLKENTGNILLHIMLAKIHFAQREYTEALTKTDLLLKNSIKTPEILYIGALSSLNVKDLNKAESYIKLLKTLAPDKWPSMHAEILSLLAKGDKQSAFKLSDKALGLYPDNAEALTLFAGLAPALITREEAIKKVQDICSRSKGAYCHMVLSTIFEGAGNKDEALEQIKKAIEIAPEQTGLYHALAQFYARNSMIKQALKEYEDILNKKPDDLHAAIMLATLYQNEGKGDDAKKVYNYILNKDPKHTIAANNLAWMLAEEGDKNNLNRALQLAQVAKDKYPDDPRIADTLGYVYFKKGLYDNALAQFSLAVEKLAEEPTINYHMALALKGKDRGKEAISYLNKALTSDKKFQEKDQAKGLLAELKAAKK